MIRLATRLNLVALGALALGAAQSTLAQIPQDRPFSMRGVELGITLPEFRQVAIPLDDDRYDRPRTFCSNEELPIFILIPILGEDKADGIVECQWRSSNKRFSTEIPETFWVYIGTGGGEPEFQFISSDGALRLFRILFYSNEDYYGGVLDALTRGYGAPKTAIEPFETKGGGKFTSARSVWTNRLSTITLVQRCGQLDRYCLTYEHTELGKRYQALQEQRAAKAATKI